MNRFLTAAPYLVALIVAVELAFGVIVLASHDDPWLAAYSFLAAAIGAQVLVILIQHRHLNNLRVAELSALDARLLAAHRELIRRTRPVETFAPPEPGEPGSPIHGMPMPDGKE